MPNSLALLPGEQIVTSSNNDVLVLTNKRVRYESVVWGQSQLVSIALTSVASCGLITRSYPILLLVGVIFFIASLSLSQRDGIVMGIIGVGVFIGLYFYTRKAVISVASNGGESIVVPTQGMKREAIVAFLNAVEREKLSSRVDR